MEELSIMNISLYVLFPMNSKKLNKVHVLLIFLSKFWFLRFPSLTVAIYYIGVLFQVFLMRVGNFWVLLVVQFRFGEMEIVLR